MRKTKDTSRPRLELLEQDLLLGIVDELFFVCDPIHFHSCLRFCVQNFQLCILPGHLHAVACSRDAVVLSLFLFVCSDFHGFALRGSVPSSNIQSRVRCASGLHSKRH